MIYIGRIKYKGKQMKKVAFETLGAVNTHTSSLLIKNKKMEYKKDSSKSL